MKEEKIIKDAVRKAVSSAINADATVAKTEIARRAAILANRRGVNVMEAPYLQDVFYACLSEVTL